MKTLLLGIAFLAVHITNAAAKIPDARITLDNLDKIELQNGTITFRATGAVKLFVVVKAHLDGERNWSSFGRPARIVEMYAQDCLFTVQPFKLTGNPETDNTLKKFTHNAIQLMKAFKKGDKLDILVQQADIVVENNLIKGVKGIGLAAVMQ